MQQRVPVETKVGVLEEAELLDVDAGVLPRGQLEVPFHQRSGLP